MYNTLFFTHYLDNDDTLSDFLNRDLPEKCRVIGVLMMSQDDDRTVYQIVIEDLTDHPDCGCGGEC